MEILKAEIKFMKSDGFSDRWYDGVRHRKILPWLSIVQSLEGSYEISLGGGKFYRTEEGGFFIAPSGIWQDIIHRVNEQSGKISCRWIFLDALINDSFRFDSLLDLPVIPAGELMEELKGLFDEFFNTGDLFLQYGLCYRMLGALRKNSTEKKKAISSDLAAAISYIAENYNKKIEISQLARLAHTSPSNFHAKFKRALGITPIAYLNDYRLSQAAERLLDTNLAICEIAESVGIADPLYFSKVFRGAYGLSPKEYRKQRRK